MYIMLTSLGTSCGTNDDDDDDGGGGGGGGGGKGGGGRRRLRSLSSLTPRGGHRQLQAAPPHTQASGECHLGTELVCVMFYGQDANSQYSCADGFTLRDSVQPQVQT